jgi:hypothetical protein
VSRDTFAEFLERLGHRVVRTESCGWYDMQSRFFLAFPHSVPVTLSRDELRRAFARTRGVGLRFVTPVEEAGRPSYALVVDDRAYDLEQLSPNTRSKIRRGLKACEVRRLEPKFVRDHGERANADSLARMRFTADLYEWNRYWDAVDATPSAEVWGAIRDGELLAYLVALHVEGCAEILVERSRNDGLRHYPNNALVYTAVRDLIRRPEVDRILFGLESLEAVSGVDQFKESMGLRRRPLRQRIVFHPLLAPVLGHGLVRRSVRALARRRPEDQFWRKVEGLLDFNAGPAAARPAQEEPSWTS